jgi:DNA-binding TFAR19-related protein (PDSD5 family)
MEDEELDIIRRRWMDSLKRRNQVAGELRAFQRPLIEAFEKAKKPCITLEAAKKYEILEKILAEAQEIERMAFIELIDRLTKR